MDTPLNVLMSWIKDESEINNLSVVDVYNKAKELLEYEKKFLKQNEN